MTSALVTGAAGFIGSHVAQHCVNLGFDVVGVDDLSGGFIENVPQGVEFHKGTLVDPDWVASLWHHRTYDYVYHLAAYAAEGLSHYIRRFNYTTNLVASINLINQSILHRAKCFVFSSSIAVYGANQTPMTEATIPEPEDPYGISKYAIELDLAAAYRMFGLPYVIFRPHNVYGERQNIADRYRNVIGIFMNQIMNDQPMTVFGDGLQTRAFTYIDDVAPIIARAPLVSEAYQNVFNIGADEVFTVAELARQVASAFGIEPCVQHLPERKEVVNAFASHNKMRQIFSPPEPVSLPVGLQRMAGWVKCIGSRTPVSFDAIEVPVNMPVSWRT
jgi:UDP-glucose 4-epimerase